MTAIRQLMYGDEFLVIVVLIMATNADNTCEKWQAKGK
jgi:hypothetical protein